MRAARVVFVLLALAVGAGCADAPSTSDAPSPSEAASTSSESDSGVPDEVLAALERGGTTVEDDEFRGGLSRHETLKRFQAMYTDGHPPGGEPTAYAVTIKSSFVTALSPGRSVRMVHVAGVPHRPRGVMPMPMPPPGQPEAERESEPTTMKTDLFAFFDAESGEHLVTSQGGPSN